jgi:hypothetical protein
VLLGKQKILNNEDRTKVENLDEIKYSMNSILRSEYLIYEELIAYPDSIISQLGVYGTSEEQK